MLGGCAGHAARKHLERREGHAARKPANQGAGAIGFTAGNEFQEGVDKLDRCCGLIRGWVGWLGWFVAAG